MAVTQEWTTMMQTIKEERAQASQRGMQWLEKQYVEAVLSIEYRCHDPYYYEYDGYDKDAPAILDLMLGCRLYRRRGFDSMKGIRSISTARSSIGVLRIKPWKPRADVMCSQRKSSGRSPRSPRTVRLCELRSPESGELSHQKRGTTELQRSTTMSLVSELPSVYLIAGWIT